MTYLKTAGRPGCFFCAYARQKKDGENHVLLRGRRCFVVLNRFPYNSGHLLVAPLAHKPGLARLDAGEREEVLDLLVRMQDLLGRVLRPHGFNIGANLGRAAGAGVPGHFHLHLVPRWNGDSNFMPVVGKTKVIPQALGDLYAQLQKALRKGR
jgi:ATP adenylyltransferase